MKSYKQASKDTITRCFKMTLAAAGINTILRESVHVRSYCSPYFPVFGLNRMWENTDQNNSEYVHFTQCHYLSSSLNKINFSKQGIFANVS